jgi:signal transduction histidine kinase
MVIVADEELIHRLVLNLIENAVKFTPEGGKVHVSLASEGGSYAIRVADTGPGIPLSEQERIFERFYRGDRIRPTNAGGAGLGLPIARWIAEVHGGELRLDHSGAGGSEFVAVLPNGSSEDVV